LQKRVLSEEQQKYESDGYYPDTKDPRDRIFIPWHPSWYGSWLTLPKLVDLTQSRYMPPVLDQGPYGTCVVNAAALAYGFTVCKEHRGTLGFFPSRLFLYFNTKYHIMAEYPDGEGGSFTRACCQALRKFGCCSEQSYPYKSSLVACEPPGYVYNEAKKHRVSYYVVPQTRYDIYSALSQGHPIMVSLTYILSEMPDGKKCLYLNYPDATDMDTIKNSRSSKRVGHHAVCLVGYDRKTEVVKFRNSWGENWGNQGCFYAPLEYVLNPDLANDFWIFRKAK
jgi:C1A family cysteine protease